MTKNFCDRCGIEIGECYFAAIADKPWSRPGVFYDSTTAKLITENLLHTKTKAELCEECADDLQEALKPIKRAGDAA